jgi:hypothetical protein
LSSAGRSGSAGPPRRHRARLAERRPWARLAPPAPWSRLDVVIHGHRTSARSRCRGVGQEEEEGGPSAGDLRHAQRWHLFAFCLASYAICVLCLCPLLERDLGTQNTVDDGFCVWVALCLPCWR